MGAVLHAVALVWASGQPIDIPVAPPEPAPVAVPAAEAAAGTPAPVPVAAPAPVVVPAPAQPVDGQAITVTARPKSDPAQAVNQASFELVQQVDNKLVGPAAETYKKLVPKPARAGLHNFIRNIGEPVVALNFLLQLKPGKAGETLGRFAINSTLGLGGLIDVAKGKPFNLPHRHNGFANTLGFYGVGPGPYLYLPGIGSTSLRDVVGGAVDGLILPMGIGAPFNKPYYTIPNGTIRSLDRRVEFDCQIKALQAADDPYAATRAYYLKKRQAEIDALHGRGPGPQLLEQCRNQLSGDTKAEPVAAPAPASVPAASPAPAPAVPLPPPGVEPAQPPSTASN